jgi:mono/diheme cytochrome c family protein
MAAVGLPMPPFALPSLCEPELSQARGVPMKTFLAFIGLLAIVVGIGAAVFFFGGFYSVAGTAEEPKMVNWALVQVRQASIARHAQDRPPMELNNADLVKEGARAYANRGCVNCHGAPGVEWQKFSEGLTPDPPDLKEVVEEREPRELFWVIKNGINMTGMPSFAKIEVPDREIWTIVAFIKKLPNVADDDYKAWTAPATPAPAAPAPTPPAPGGNP